MPDKIFFPFGDAQQPDKLRRWRDGRY